MYKEQKDMIIAIDGYSSCGKSTFAKKIAEVLDYLYIDSGAMYRAVTLYALRNGIITDTVLNRDLLIQELPKMQISFLVDKGHSKTVLNGKIVENEIRTIRVSEFVSQVSALEEVRLKMVEIQRKLGENRRIVMDGRDIGTVVFPNADLKIFMTASPEIRAQRRYKELVEKGEKINFEEIEKNIQYRDQYDTTREISPLRKADDAVVLDNSHLTVEEQMEWVMDIINKKRENGN